ncbi:hypothetical protein RHGRI_028083 [Rhododendron griersonianum]|uniref:CCHC-type domain-containing protein n=1 Tax=Rhododendron griersonianum TaxID=479676 RepID=A0AAV6IHL1_9ERIC|nr:hypothetical protein RHGRI_028083 [Rhododendron griersonianum]
MAEFDILDLEEGSDDSGVPNNLCLVGKVIQAKTLSASVITNILTAAWKTRAPFRVSDWNNNIFLFQFEDPEDKRLVAQDGPWSIHGLPVEKMCRANAEIIGRRFGKLIAIEAAPNTMLLSRSFLRVKVEINISLPLPKGFWLRGKTGKDLWISYIYERLPDFCYACGRIGHDNRGCRFTPRGTEGQSGYDPELRTGRARKIVVPIEEIVSPEEESEDRAENPRSRRSELQLEDDTGVGGNGTMVKPGLNVNPIINTPISPTTSPVNPTYFVTEPPDSPKNPYPNSELNPTPFSLSQPLPTPKALTSNPPKIILQPGKPTSPQNLDITLATVFKTLNLKRKPHDDLQELSSSKILRLCSPNPLTLPETAPKPPTRPNRKPSKPTRYLNSAKKGEWFPY